MSRAPPPPPPPPKITAASAVSSALANAVASVLASEGAVGMKAFRLNSGAKPRPDRYKAPASDVGDLSIGRVQVQHDDPQKWFEVKYPDIFEHYRLPGCLVRHRRLRGFGRGPLVRFRWFSEVLLPLPRVLPNTPYTERDKGLTTL